MHAKLTFLKLLRSVKFHGMCEVIPFLSKCIYSLQYYIILYHIILLLLLLLYIILYIIILYNLIHRV